MIYVLDLFLLPAVHFLAAPCPNSKDCRAISYIKFRPSRTSVSDAASSCQSQNHGNWQARSTNLALARCSSGDSSAQSRGVNRARDRRSQSAATETSRLDRAPPYHCRASIPACCFFAAGGSACPTKFPRAERIQLVGRRSAEPGKALRLDGVSPYQRRFTGSFASN